MGQLVDEVKQWNTPLVGGFLLWRFTQGYCESHPLGEAPIALLHFIASGIITHRELLDSVSNQRKNLQAYVRGFEDKKRADLLVGLQKRIMDRREYTLASIDVAISSGLLVWDGNTGKLHARGVKKSKRGNSLRHTMRKDGDKAAILGKWFSEHELSEIAAYLEVVL
jgi:hypothetical protein